MLTRRVPYTAREPLRMSCERERPDGPGGGGGGEEGEKRDCGEEVGCGVLSFGGSGVVVEVGAASSSPAVAREGVQVRRGSVNMNAL